MARKKAKPDPLVEHEGELDEFLPPAPPLGSGGGGVMAGEPEMDGFQQGNRKTEELQRQLAARSTDQPVFPYPPELPAPHRPYWLELVNSFPADHFQRSDIPLMKMYCRCAADIERQTLMIETEGEVVMGGRGPMVNPRVKVRTDAQNMLLSITTKFRNQPASRVNTENFKNRQGKAQTAGEAAQAIGDDEDGLLAGGVRH